MNFKIPNNFTRLKGYKILEDLKYTEKKGSKINYKEV